MLLSNQWKKLFDSGKISKIRSESSGIVLERRARPGSGQWSRHFPKRLIDKLFSSAMVNQRAFGKTRGKLFILEKRSDMVHQKRFTKNHQRDYSRTSVYLSIIAFNLPPRLPRSTLDRRKERERKREERNTSRRIAFFRILYFLIRTNSDLETFNRIHFTSRCFLLQPSSSTTFFHFILAFH